MGDQYVVPDLFTLIGRITCDSKIIKIYYHRLRSNTLVNLKIEWHCDLTILLYIYINF